MYRFIIDDEFREHVTISRRPKLFHCIQVVTVTSSQINKDKDKPALRCNLKYRMRAMWHFAFGVLSITFRTKNTILSPTTFVVRRDTPYAVHWLVYKYSGWIWYEKKWWFLNVFPGMESMLRNSYSYDCMIYLPNKHV